MARDDAPPFARGETYYNGTPIDTNNLGGENLLGKEYVFEPNSQDQGTGYPAGQDPNGRPIRVKVVRNLSGSTLKGGRLAHFLASSSQNLETGIDGYTDALADVPAGVIDEFLPPAGVLPNDLCYLVIDGPTNFTSMSSGTPSLAIGQRLVPATGTSRTSDDSGRVTAQDLTGATATLGNNIQNRVGLANAAVSTTNAIFSGVVHRLR